MEQTDLYEFSSYFEGYKSRIETKSELVTLKSNHPDELLSYQIQASQA